MAWRLGYHQPAADGDLGGIWVTVISNMPLRRFQIFRGGDLNPAVINGEIRIRGVTQDAWAWSLRSLFLLWFPGREVK